MIVRLTYLSFSPEKIGEMKKFYNEVAIPTVKSQKGNLDCKLLEPIDRKEEYISMTVWDNQEDANAYQETGVYKSLVDQVRPFFTKEPVLSIYQAEDIMEHA
jgi:heme-degrading monooxygenase HmoA